MNADPALRFWLRWAERDGALYEPAADATLVVLSDGLQRTLDLPDEVSVTADPEVAREDGAMLLGPGHPALDHATEDVLRCGDVGHVSLAAPAAAPPEPATLLARARDTLTVGHGRIDLAGVPELERIPVLRADALVTYSVALHERFQERAEAWLAVPGQVSLPAETVNRLAGAPRDTALPAVGMPDGLAATVAAAHDELQHIAAHRQAVLVDQVEETRATEVARTTAYYDAATAAIEHRLETASPDRLAVLEAKLEATRAERARRLAEVEEKFRPRHEIRLFRLHLVWVPTLRLPMVVRRGHREFPLAMYWLTVGRGFLPVPCPSCGGLYPLEAAKDRLGCQGCVRRAAAPSVVPTRAVSATDRGDRGVGKPTSGTSGSQPPLPVPATTPPAAPSSGKGQAASQSPSNAPGARPGLGKPPQPRSRVRDAQSDRDARVRLVAAGDKLAVRFWQAVSAADRRLGRILAPDSPAAALHRLYGASGPAWVLGLEPGDSLVSVTTTTLLQGRPEITCGVVETPRSGRYYTLRWASEHGRPAILEVLPITGARGLRLPKLPGAQTGHAPEPRIELDPVAAALWRAQVPGPGLPLTLRCLAAWWRVAGKASLAGYEASALAAAVLHQVGRAAGLQLTYPQVSAACAADEPLARRGATVVRRFLALSSEQPW